MNRFYPLGVESFANAQISWLADTIRVVATSGYAFSGLHQFLSDIPAPQRIAISAPLAVKTTNAPTPGVLDAADTFVTLPPLSPAIGSFVIYQDTGVPATSRLILFEDGAILVTAGCPALAAATLVEVLALISALPIGTSMTFSGGAVAVLTAPAPVGSLALTVAPLALPIAAGETAQASTGSGLPLPASPAGGVVNVVFDSGPNRIGSL